MMRMVEMLTTMYGLLPSNIRLLTDYDESAAPRNGPPSRAEILAALSWLPQGLTSGDHAFLMIMSSTRREASVLTNYIIPSDHATAGIISGDLVILTCVLHLPSNSTLTIWLDSNHPTTPINQLQYMFEGRAYPKSALLRSGLDPVTGRPVVIENEFSNQWFLRDDKSTSLPLNVVMYASVMDNSTPSTASANIGKMTSVLLDVLTESQHVVRNRTLVKVLHVACNRLHLFNFRPVMSMSNRGLFNAWFLRNSRPASMISFL
jgi:hypothetical protein